MWGVKEMYVDVRCTIRKITLKKCAGYDAAEIRSVPLHLIYRAFYPAGDLREH